MDEEIELLPAVKGVLKTLGLKEDSSNCSPSLAMLGGMRIIAELSESLADQMKSKDFWDGGDDIDYTNAIGELIQKFTYAVAFEYETADLTIALNHLANVMPEAETETDDELLMAMEVAGCGGYESSTLNAIYSCNVDR